MKQILLAAGDRLPVRYIAALHGVGARPTVDDGHREPLDFDGLVLCGGGDPEPALYGRPTEGSYAIDRQRDQRELWLLHRFLGAKRPVLAICRGHQLLNVAFGGSLIQHLPTAHLHQGQGGDLWHPVEARGPLKQLLGPSPTVNSAHHQGIDRLGRGLQVMATAPDGLIEGVVHQHLPVWGVQFHPERMDRGERLFEWLLQ